ncbi:MAG: hypothetical protein Q9162_001768 [Coniocarpon cinnabarinum]
MSGATENSPLIQQRTQSKGSDRGQRSVTFNPQVSTVSARTSPNRPPLATSASAKPSSGSQGQPVLSALNQKLRRRHSHGLLLQQTPSAAKIGAQRTTKHASKLKLLPDPDQGDDQADEESGKEVYSQFTRIKDPNARRDAARLGKDDRDKLPRVTAYCTANGLKLDECVRYLRSRAKARGAAPKLFDECIYSPYSYEKEPQNMYDNHWRPSDQNDGTSQSLNPPRSATPPPRPGSGRRFSESAVDVDDSSDRKQGELVEFQDTKASQAPARDSSSSGEGTVLAVDQSKPIASLVAQPTPGEDPSRFTNPDFDTRVHTPEVFLFDYGTVVIWGMTESEEERFLKEISRFETEKLSKDDVQAENFNFYYTRDYQARIYNDFISLRDKRNYMTKLAISHALAQSVKTSLYEDLVDNTIGDTQHIPSQLASTGKTGLSQRQIAMRIGELFILRINIHLQGSVLDSPELMWSEPGLEPVYAAARGYLELDTRCGLLTERLDVIADLLAVLKDQSGQVHGEFLEWIVIVLIAAEIIVAAVNIVVDLYAGVD